MQQPHIIITGLPEARPWWKRVPADTLLAWAACLGIAFMTWSSHEASKAHQDLDRTLVRALHSCSLSPEEEQDAPLELTGWRP